MNGTNEAGARCEPSSEPAPTCGQCGVVLDEGPPLMLLFNRAACPKCATLAVRVAERCYEVNR